MRKKINKMDKTLLLLGGLGAAYVIFKFETQDEITSTPTVEITQIKNIEGILPLLKLHAAEIKNHNKPVFPINVVGMIILIPTITALIIIKLIAILGESGLIDINPELTTPLLGRNIENSDLPQQIENKQEVADNLNETNNIAKSWWNKFKDWYNDVKSFRPTSAPQSGFTDIGKTTIIYPQEVNIDIEPEKVNVNLETEVKQEANDTITNIVEEGFVAKVKSKFTSVFKKGDESSDIFAIEELIKEYNYIVSNSRTMEKTELKKKIKSLLIRMEYNKELFEKKLYFSKEEKNIYNILIEKYELLKNINL